LVSRRSATSSKPLARCQQLVVCQDGSWEGDGWPWNAAKGSRICCLQLLPSIGRSCYGCSWTTRQNHVQLFSGGDALASEDVSELFHTIGGRRSVRGVSEERWASSVGGLCPHTWHEDATFNGVSTFVIFDGNFLIPVRQFSPPEAANSQFWLCSCPHKLCPCATTFPKP
jgi:hypothetical protein